jgi:homoserine O-acetyltransferase
LPQGQLGVQIQVDAIDLRRDDQIAGISEEDAKPGWWDNMIGPGKAFDTNKYFVVCTNVLGGCRGTTGPSSINPETGRPYGSSFPFVTIADMVRLQKLLMDYLGVERLLSLAGGSMGGMQVLRWVVDYPDAVASAIPIATTYRHSPQQIAFNEVGRLAIMADPNFRDGDYYGQALPAQGLAVARAVGHITYMSDDSMREKFGRRRRTSVDTGDGNGGLFEVESYLRYRGDQFVTRFDANSYLVISRAMDSFDLANGYKSLSEAFADAAARFLVLSFSSDWLYTTRPCARSARCLASSRPAGHRCCRSPATIRRAPITSMDTRSPTPRPRRMASNDRSTRTTSRPCRSRC